MNPELARRVETLNADYERVAGERPRHFFCPILYRDEEVELCKGHIVNEAFGGAQDWTVQRADVDSFYGSKFESDFTDMRYAGWEPSRVLADPTASGRLRPTFKARGIPVEHYRRNGPVPDGHKPVLVPSDSGDVPLAFKVAAAEFNELRQADLQLGYWKDLRIPTLVSTLKAAHLTMFHMLGYRYALSAGGRFLGDTVLGKFFLANRGHKRPQVLAAGEDHFREFAAMMRPMTAGPDFLGAVSDGCLHLAVHGDVVWAFLVVVRAGLLLNTVLVPAFGDAISAGRFMTFITGKDELITTRFVQYANDEWVGPEQLTEVRWPKTGTLYPD